MTRSGSLSAFSRPDEPVARDLDFVALVFELELQDAADRRVVLDDEDLYKNVAPAVVLLHAGTLSAGPPCGPVRGTSPAVGIR